MKTFRSSMDYEDRKGRFITRSGWLVMSYILVVLGVAALTWAWAVNGWMGIGRERRMEQRSQQTVGATLSEMKKPITLSVEDSTCLKQGTGRVDGSDVWFYIKNTCDHWLDNPNYYYRVMAPDGTVIQSHQWAFDGDRDIGPHERREQQITIDAEDRAASVNVAFVEYKERP